MLGVPASHSRGPREHHVGRRRVRHYSHPSLKRTRGLRRNTQLAGIVRRNAAQAVGGGVCSLLDGHGVPRAGASDWPVWEAFSPNVRARPFFFVDGENFC